MLQPLWKDVVAIIDCREVFIERPKNLTARGQTIYLIAITPSGAVKFLSAGWGGRVSDKQVSIDSGFFDKI